jgi:cation:H+ antiporter
MMFRELSPWLNAAIFSGAAIAVWFAGAKLARAADELASRTGIGREFLGILLLGGVTSLPELAVATTATLQGAPALSINDVIGSAAVNVVVLAVADAVSGRGALTATQGSPILMLQGVIGMLLLALAAAPALTGDVGFAGAGVWSWIMLAVYLASIRLLSDPHASRAWRAVDSKERASGEEHDGESAAGSESLAPLIRKLVATGAVILIAGILLARTGDALSMQTGLGGSFFGVVFLALATSLPEWSTVIAAVRLGRHEMAIADVFGTNLFNVTIIVLVDVLHPGPPVMPEAGRFAAFAALLALALTAFFVLGMLERRNRTVLRMGFDSIAVLAAYGAGVMVLYGLR